MNSNPGPPECRAALLNTTRWRGSVGIHVCENWSVIYVGFLWKLTPDRHMLYSEVKHAELVPKTASPQTISATLWQSYNTQDYWRHLFIILRRVWENSPIYSVTKLSHATSASHETVWWGIRPKRILSLFTEIWQEREEDSTSKKNAMCIWEAALPLGSMEGSNFGHQDLPPCMPKLLNGKAQK
jgi:hypothetical protein